MRIAIVAMILAFTAAAVQAHIPDNGQQTTMEKGKKKK